MSIRIGFIGLGQMGEGMARNLVAHQDTELVVLDLKPERVKALCDAGAVAAESIKDIAACPLIFISVPGGKELTELILGEQGMLPLLTVGQTVVDLSTVVLSATRQVAEALKAKGVDFLDAPVSGMEKGAREGTLAVMVGGDEAVFNRVKPYFDRIGKTVVHMGGTGAGQLTKAVNNSLYDICIAGTAEMLMVGLKAGLDPVKLGSVINGSSGRSYASEFFIPRILEGKFTGIFPLASAYKDLVTSNEIAIENEIPVPILSAVTNVYRATMQKEYNPLQDKGAMIRFYEEVLGMQYRKQ